MNYDMSRQEQIDRAMCKPGYTGNETVGRCWGGGAVLPEDGEMPAPPMPTPDDAIKGEIASRESTGEVA